MKERWKKFGIIPWILVVLLLAVDFLLPKTGSLVLLDECCGVLILWIASFYVAFRIRRAEKARTGAVKALRVFVIAVLFVFSALFTVNPVMDLASGTEKVALSDIEVYHSQGSLGVFSNHYYLTGTDRQGQYLRLEISGDDYRRLANADRRGGDSEVRAEIYRHTRRVVMYL